jgi:Protein of unknown function (DUF3108)
VAENFPGKGLFASLLFICGTVPAMGASPAADSGVQPFAAHFMAEWKGIGIATSDLVLRRDAAPDTWIYTWRITARGIFRLAYSEDLVQTSWFTLSAGHVHTNRYEATQGSQRIKLDFDWDAHHARGTEQGKPLDLALQENTQDVLSIQIEVMQDLRNDTLPAKFSVLDKDEVKEFNYTREGTERIRTALGMLDTIKIASQREGNNRILHMWFAPSLGFAPVQAERTRDGKSEFAMRIRSLDRS